MHRGNWIKIVQRVPVRIALDPQELSDHPLRVGLSVSVEVDVRDQSGPLVTSRVGAGTTRANTGEDSGPRADAMIARILKAKAAWHGERTRRARLARSKPMTGALLAVTALALAMGTFMQVLDSTIANVSLPTIAGNLGVSTDQGTWVITAFAVANGIGVPLTGWLMGRYGVVRTFVVSVLAFTIASFLCGIAWSLPSLIFFRVLQGGVSGPMIPG